MQFQNFTDSFGPISNSVTKFRLDFDGSVFIGNYE